jgi:hypothetical protein
MKRRIFLGAFAISVIVACTGGAVATAAKLPEWGQCSAQANGRYRDAACIQRAHVTKEGVPTGSYEWHALESRIISGARSTPQSFRLVGTMTFETRAGKKITCSALNEASEIDVKGPKGAGTPLWEFANCESEGRRCEGDHAPRAGEINNFYAWFEEPGEPGEPVPGWTGLFGFVARNGVAPEVGLTYTVLNKERLFEPVKCEGPIGTVWIGGAPKGNDSFASYVEPVNQMSGEFKQRFVESSPGVQQPARFLGQLTKNTTEAFLENHWEPVAISGTFEFGFEGAEVYEIKASP